MLITGATSGIGRAAAKAFAHEGAKVAFCGRREALGRDLEREIKADGGEALYVKADVRLEDEVANLVDRTVQAYGGLDIALNNAGITLEKPIHEFTGAEGRYRQHQPARCVPGDEIRNPPYAGAWKRDDSS